MPIANAQTANSFWRSSLGTGDDGLGSPAGGSATLVPTQTLATDPDGYRSPFAPQPQLPRADGNTRRDRRPLDDLSTRAGMAGVTPSGDRSGGAFGTSDSSADDALVENPDDPLTTINLPRQAAGSSADPDAQGIIQRAGRTPGVNAADAQTADPVPRRIAEEADPYAAPGLRLGTIRVLPTLGLYGGLEWEEAEQAGGNTDRAFTDIEPGLRLETDWSRHAATLDLRGQGRIGPDDDLEETYDVEARAVGRLDIGPTALGTDTTVTLELGAREQVGERLTSALPGDRALTGVGENGLVGSVTPFDTRREANRETTLLGSLGVDHEIGRLNVGLTGEAERSDETMGQEATTLRLTGRAGIEGAQASPFVEASVARTRYCDTCSGDFDALGALAGLRLRDDRRLSGEVAVGYETRRDTDTDATDTGLIWRGSLAYELTPLITLDIATEATLGDADDAASRTVTFGVVHRPRRWLTLSGGLALTWEDFEVLTDTGTATGTTRSLTASLGAEYRLNRYVAINADATQNRDKDGITGAESVVNTVRLGVTLRR